MRTTIDIPAAREAVTKVVSDPSEKPEFRRELAVRLDAFDGDGAILFRTFATVGGQ